MTGPSPIPVVDLFAGPGGLGEGFASLIDGNGRHPFKIGVSIEKDEIAHRTLSLRAFFRAFPDGTVPESYYNYVQGKITRAQLLADPSVSLQATQALDEARHAELGKTPHQTIDGWIRKAIRGAADWVLIGGPPCQAYSLAGRSRIRPMDPKAFENDKRHFLYTEYLRIIRVFRPSLFVMENVKGMLSSKHGGTHIFARILADLSKPARGLAYQVRSLTVAGDDLDPMDYLIKSENFGIPQSRHRVILFGIRSDLAASSRALARNPSKFQLKPAPNQVSVVQALDGLPAIRSRLSKAKDSPSAWLSTLAKAKSGLKLWRSPLRSDIEAAFATATLAATAHVSSGTSFDGSPLPDCKLMPVSLREWLHDTKMVGVLQHQARGHMGADLHRYLFAACFAMLEGRSPKLTQFPPKMLPAHKNVDAPHVPFVDRFRVQIDSAPSTTVVSHIAKDGHYYIHPDPSQCRSLTVREAARLQTFPDNYYFEGNRTQQYHQVGNAVPPLLARQIAEVVLEFMRDARR